MSDLARVADVKAASSVLGPPTLILDRVHGRDTPRPGARTRGTIVELSLSLRSGVHVFLGAPEDGTLALLELVMGARPPSRGKVLLAGRDPSQTPALRARLGALSPEPQLPGEGSVAAAVALALRARGEGGARVDALLEPFGLAPLLGRSVRSLSYAEARAVELALALTTRDVLLLALHEPLVDVAIPRPSIVEERIREAARAGACVVVTTSSPADARAMGDRIFVLHKGFLVREALASGSGLSSSDAELVVWVREPSVDAPLDGAPRAGARELAAALGRHRHVRRVTWEDGGEGESGAELVPPLPVPGTSVVRVRGENAEACALALSEAALETGARIEAIVPSAPDLTEVRAGTESLLRLRFGAPFAAAERARAALVAPPSPPAAPRPEKP